MPLKCFGNDYLAWVIWHDNRRGLRDRVLFSRKLKKRQAISVLDTDTEAKLLHDDTKTKDRPIDSGKLTNLQYQPHSDHLYDCQDDIDDSSGECAEIATKQLLQEEQDVANKTDTNKSAQVFSVPKTFNISINKKKWRAIRPRQGSTKLRKSWTHVIYDAFNKVNPNCFLAFKYQHATLPHSRKRIFSFLNIRALCTFPTCKAQYRFLMKRKPTALQKRVFMTVYHHGKICHLKKHTQKRQASNICRGKIAKIIHQGVSRIYYSKLRKTPVEEIIAGNL